MAIQDNLFYFNYSLVNQDEFADFTNSNGLQVIANSKNDTPYPLQQANKKLVENIITYKTLKSSACSQNTIDKIVQNIVQILDNTELINYSPFCVYFQVLKFPYASYKKIKDKAQKTEIVKKILDCYLTNRHEMYSSYGYSDQSLQIMADCSSSRRNSKTGIIKVENIIKPLGFIHAASLHSFETSDLCYILPDKGDKDLFHKILEEYKIDFIFQKKRDNKYPDMLIKIKDKIYILEHKLTNGEGGSQNAEINEIISFIGENETNPKVSYISCLQGDYMVNISANKKQKKVQSQIKNINTNLNTHKNNFFVNGKGFEKLMKDLVN